MQDSTGAGERAFGRVGGPFRRYLERRFTDVHLHLENSEALVGVTRDAVHAVEQRMHAVLETRIERLEQQLATIAAELRVSGEVAGELARVNSRTVGRLEAHVGELSEQTRHALEQLLVERGPESGDRAVEELVGTKASEIGPGTARFLNWLETLDGYKAQRDVLLTPQVVTAYRAGGVDVAWVTERVLENAYLFGALADLDPGSTILDFGASFSTNAVALASMGHRVTALDVNPYPFTHPNLTTVATPGEEWSGPAEPFDAIVCMSALEHVGLGHYGDPRGAADLDVEMMARFRSWIASGGTLVLTVPYGPGTVDDVQRVYDDEGLARLLAGWVVRDEQRFVQHDRRTWAPFDRPLDAATWHDSWGVALITATPS